MRTARLTTLLIAGLLAAGCGKSRPSAGQPQGGSVVTVPAGGADPTATVTVNTATCTACHGDVSRPATAADPLIAVAPPRGLRGETTSADRAVGAHDKHLRDGAFSRALACANCHLVPSAPLAHRPQGQGRVTFGSLAVKAWTGAPTPQPTWNGASCSATYCHGGFPGGLAASPTWTASGVTCGTCHGIPPAFWRDGVTAHTTSTACGTCHGGSYTDVAVDLSLHMNGTLDVTGGHTPGWKEPDQHGLAALNQASASVQPQGGAAFAGCTSCHVGFGAVAGGGTISDCNACHADPAGVGGTFTTGVYPAHTDWKTECTFCHGGRSGDTEGAPPRDTHIISSNATVQTGTDPTVGAHASHTRALHGIAAALDCTACHPARWASAADLGHVNGTVADVAFGNVGSTANPGTYGRPSCSTNYCHGSFTYGAAASPSWTGTFGATFTLDCSSCHGAPPALSSSSHHPQNTTCASCHGAGYATTGITGAALATHVDGSQQKPSNGCTACHGVLAGPAPAAAVTNASPTAAPGSGAGAVDTAGNTATSARGVGAHGKHLNTTLRTGAACTDCHALPANGDTSHATGPNATLTWGAVATAGGSTPTASQSTSNVTCSSTWCHGAKLSGGTLTGAIGWNAGTTISGCTACHGSPPTTTSTGHFHPQNTNCGACHTGYTSTTVQASTHVNGKVEVLGADIAVTNLLTCTTCHGTPARPNGSGAGTFDANQAAAPPTDSSGASTGQHVGAHLAHVNPAAAGQAYPPIACTECHPNDASTLHATAANGGVPVVSFALSTAARLDGASPSYTGATPSCNTTYCHGASFQAATQGAITAAGGWTWTAGPAACDSCHAMPPSTSGHSALAHPSPATVCANCHGATVNVDGTINVAGGKHIDGTVEGGESVGGQNCSICHLTIFSAMNGAVAKPFKHTLGNVVGSNDSPTDTSADWTGATLAGSVSAANRSCVNMCHGDHPHTIPGVTTHENNVYVNSSTQATRGAASAATRAATDHVPGSATDGLCISCHARPVDGTPGRITVTSITFNNTGHDFNANTVAATGTTYTWEFVMHDGSKFPRNCTKCHAGGAGEDQPSVNTTDLGAVHYADNDSLLMGTSVASGGTATQASFVCYKCHGNGANGTIDRTGVDVRTQILLGKGHGAADTDALHNTFTEAAAAFGGTAFAGAGRHVNCLDCHDPHESGKTNRDYNVAATATRNQIPAGSPITGALGIQFGTVASGKTYPALPASGSWPASTASNYGNSLVRATYEYEVCFKCHTAFAFGGTSAVTTQIGPSGLAETDLGMEFSPNMRSGHPVVAPLGSYAGSAAPKGLTAAQMRAPFTAVGTQTMTCTDCHSGDAAAPAAQGPHGSAASFMLRGVNKTWPGTFTLGTWSTNFNNAAGTGLFCVNCHPMRAGATSPPTGAWLNNVHSQGNHTSRTCTACHILIPHGGKVSRLIAAQGAGTSTLPARYTTATNGSVVLEFTKAASPNGYDTPNCAASCNLSTHPTGSGGETW